MSYKENAKRFLKYLHDNDCTTTGALGEKEVLIDEGSYHCVIRLVSQADALIIEFFLMKQLLLMLLISNLKKENLRRLIPLMTFVLGMRRATLHGLLT